MNQETTSYAKSNSYKKLFSLYMKTNRKRILITILIGSLIFLALTGFFMTWYNYRYKVFFNYIDQNYSWTDDGEFSIYSNEYLTESSSIENDLLNLGIEELITELENLMPNVQRSYNGRLRIKLFNRTSDSNYDEYLLQTFDSSIMDIIESNIAEGRLPQNYTEMIYYKSTGISDFNVGEIIELSGIYRNESENYKPVNYTIVGIIENLDAKLNNMNISTDLFEDTNYFWEKESNAQFFTTNDFFYELINTVENFTSILNAAVDIEYKLTINHIQNLNEYLNSLKEINKQLQVFDHMPGDYVLFCNDLINALESFERVWQVRTMSLIGASIPIVILFGVIGIETLNINNHEQETNYRLLKTIGLKKKLLVRIIILENSITNLTSLLIGFIVGLFIGFPIFKGINLPKEVSYFAALNEAMVIIVLLLIFGILFIIKTLTDYFRFNTVSTTSTIQYKSKRNRILRRIFTIPELTSFLPGVLLSGLGIIFLVVLLPREDIVPSINQLIFFFFLVTAFGILLTLISIFLLTGRLLDLLYRSLGKILWRKKKNYLTLAVKHLSIYSKNHQRTILAILLLGLGVIPGLIMTESLNQHSTLEAYLTTGCSDLLIENWPTGNIIRDNITDIEGILKTAEVKIHEISYITSENIEYKIRLFNIQNITEYIDVVNLNLTSDGYSKDDILKLEIDYNYLMNREYVKKNDIANGINFTTELITNEIYQPIEMNYINDFSYYPLLSRYERLTDTDIFSAFLIEEVKIDLVVSKNTTNLILNSTDYGIMEAGYLLIKTESNANITKIQEDLSVQLGYKSLDPNQVKQTIMNTTNKFSEIFLITSAIFSFIIITLFGMVNAENTYSQKIRFIETAVQVGAKRPQIWGILTIELLFVTLIPLIISIGIAIPIINTFSGYLMNVTELYKKFSPWQPWWLLVLIAITGLILLIAGFLVRIIPKVNEYRPIKQE